MKQLVLSALAGSLLLGSAATQTPDADAKAWAEHRKTRVLYAGWSDGSREKAFEPFLRQWFDTVGIVNLEKLSVATAKDYDVVIADWCSQYGNDGYAKRENSLYSPSVDLGPDFTKPVIAMDYVSSALRGQHKLDWL
ncbi:MAG TPA: hypothetical protein VFT55_10190 [Planctomycetota bacterium]|nr:hypothetical protein [Planctomycetota bacterium]